MLYICDKLFRVMDNLLDNLKKYLESNSLEKVLEDWATTAKWDNVGIAATEYFSHQYFTYTNKSSNNNNKFSSEFNSSSFIFSLI